VDRNSIGLADFDAEGPKWLLKNKKKIYVLNISMSPCSARKAFIEIAKEIYSNLVSFQM
jgi:hypothetical protein